MLSDLSEWHKLDETLLGSQCPQRVLCVISKECISGDVEKKSSRFPISLLRCRSGLTCYWTHQTSMLDS